MNKSLVSEASHLRCKRMALREMMLFKDRLYILTVSAHCASDSEQSQPPVVPSENRQSSGDDDTGKKESKRDIEWEVLSTVRVSIKCSVSGVMID